MTKRNPIVGAAVRGDFTFAPMTEGDFRQVHLATLEVLERTGLFIESDEALDVFADGGCRVDRDRHLVRIPPHVVEEAIASAPERILLYGRDNPDHDVVLEPGRVGFTNFSEALQYVDPESGVRRAATKADLAGIARMADCLSEIDTFCVAAGAHDVPTMTAGVHNAEAQLLNTTKPVDAGPLNREDVRDILAMGAILAGGADELRERPILFMGACPFSPLKILRESCEIIIDLARAGIADNILSMAMSGASAPVTLAGTLVVHNAEVLGGLVLAQLAERGAPVLYGSSTTAMDLRLATAAVGSPECGMVGACVAFIARQYRLPSYIAGSQGDAKLGDAQLGHEKTITALVPALAGASLLYGSGVTESGVTFDPAQFVLDNEIARMVKHVVRGVPVADATLLVDDVHEIGQFGDFLSLPSTFARMREPSTSLLFDRRVREYWEADGGRDVYENAREAANRILGEHMPRPVDPVAAAEIRTIVEAADRDRGGSA